MKYLKIFTDFKSSMKRLSYEERGRLFTAMLEYAETGEEPVLDGNEDILWPVAQMQIDACKTTYEGKVDRAQKNGSMRAATTDIGSEQPKTTDIGSEQPKHDKDKDKDKEKDNDKDKDKDHGETVTRASALDRRFSAHSRFDIFWAAYPKKVGKQDAFKAFARAKVTDDLLATMITAIQQQRASPQWQKDGGRFIPNPATWIRQGRWEDEVAQPSEDPRLAMLRQIGAELDAERGVYA